MPDFYIEKLENHPDNGYDGEVDVKLDLWKMYTQQFWEEEEFLLWHTFAPWETILCC